jgi:hypothetical protein
MLNRSEIYSVQIRMNIRLRDQIKKLSSQHEMPIADIVRLSLDIGARALENLLEAQEVLIKEYLRLLKNDCKRKGRKKTQAKSDSLKIL